MYIGRLWFGREQGMGVVAEVEEGGEVCCSGEAGQVGG